MENFKKNRKIIFLFILCLTSVGIGYCTIVQAFKTTVTTAATTDTWNVKITNVDNGTATGGAYNLTNPKVTASSINVGVSFINIGDAMTYKLTVQNNGTINAILNNITYNPKSSSSYKIEFTNLKAGTQLPAGDKIDVYFKVTCLDNTNIGEKVSFLAVLDYVQDNSSIVISNSTTEIINSYQVYNVGDEVSLTDNSKWYVLNDNGKDGYITLLSKDIIHLNSKERTIYKTDESGNIYPSASCTRNCNVKYEDSQIKKFLNETYRLKLEKLNINLGVDNEIRLITINEIGSVSALMQVDGKFGVSNAPSWLASKTYNTYYTMTNGENSMYVMKKNGNLISSDLTGTANLRPVIKILKSNIQK